jgi:ribosomal protein S18 acetylase RimI-like enzyme
MIGHVLDNPIWASLSSLHRGLALGTGGVLRYPGEIAPFLGVAGPGPVDAARLESLLGSDETLYLIGPKPIVPAGWELKDLGRLVQMVCEAPLAEVEGPEIVPLTEPHHASVLALTALVYPHYFRRRTMELGRYFGMIEGGRLAAMIGERMGAPRFREVSAVCTHPDFIGRGYARRLLAFLTNENLRSGDTPFLHVSPLNERARALYEQNGYRTRSMVPFWSLGRERKETISAQSGRRGS